MGLVGDAGEVTEDVFNTTWSWVKPVRHDVPIMKKGYLSLVGVLAEGAQKAQRELAITTRQLSEKDEIIGELKVKVCFSADDAITLADLQIQLAVKNARLAILEESSVNLKRFLSSLTRSHGALRVGLESARADIARGERFIWDFANRVCKGYLPSARAQSASHRDRLNAVLADAQQRGEYRRGFRVRVSETGFRYRYMKPIVRTSVRGHTLPCGANDDDVEVFPPQTGPSLCPFSVYYASLPKIGRA